MWMKARRRNWMDSNLGPRTDDAAQSHVSSRSTVPNKAEPRSISNHHRHPIFTCQAPPISNWTVCQLKSSYASAFSYTRTRSKFYFSTIGIECVIEVVAFGEKIFVMSIHHILVVNLPAVDFAHARVFV
jgi:hypothetical protein